MYRTTPLHSKPSSGSIFLLLSGGMRRFLVLTLLIVVVVLVMRIQASSSGLSSNTTTNFKRFNPNIIDDVIYMPQEGELTGSNIAHRGNNPISQMCFSYLPASSLIKLGSKCIDTSEVLNYSGSGGLGRVLLKKCLNTKINNNQKFMLDRENMMIRVNSFATCLESREIETSLSKQYLFTISNCDVDNRNQKFIIESGLIKSGVNMKYCLSGKGDVLRYELCSASDSNQKFVLEELDSDFLTGMEIYQTAEPFLIRFKSTCLASTATKVISERCDGKKATQRFEYDPLTMRLLNIGNGQCLKGLNSKGVALSFATCADVSEQQFIYKDGAIRQFGNQTLCIDMTTGSSGATKDCNALDLNQKMYLIALEKNSTGGINPITGPETTFILQHVVSNRCLDDRNAEYPGVAIWGIICDSNNVNQYLEYSSDTQQFRNPFKDMCFTSDLQFDLCDINDKKQKFTINNYAINSVNLAKCLSFVQNEKNEYSFATCDANDINQVFVPLELTRHSRNGLMSISTTNGAIATEDTQPTISKQNNKAAPFLIMFKHGCLEYYDKDNNYYLRISNCDPTSAYQSFKYDFSYNRIMNVKSGMCLDDYDKKLKLWTCDEMAGNGMVFYSSDMNKIFSIQYNLCLDTDSGTTTKLWECLNYNENQKVALYPFETDSNNGNLFANGLPSDSTTKFILQHSATKKCLDDNDVDMDSLSEKSARLFYCDSFNPNQVFYYSNEQIRSDKGSCLTSSLKFKACQSGNDEFKFTYNLNTLTLKSRKEGKCLSFSSDNSASWIDCNEKSIDKVFKIVEVSQERKFASYPTQTYGSFYYNPTDPSSKNKERPFLIVFPKGCMFAGTDKVLRSKACDATDSSQLFTFDYTVNRIVHVSTDQCIDNNGGTNNFILKDCDISSNNQQIVFDPSAQRIRDLGKNRYIQQNIDLSFSSNTNYHDNQIVGFLDLTWSGSKKAEGPKNLPSSTPFIIRKAVSGLCLTRVDQALVSRTCNSNSTNQQFTYNSNKQLIIQGSCLYVDGGSILLGTCRTDNVYKFDYVNSFQIKSVQTGLCLDVSTTEAVVKDCSASNMNLLIPITIGTKRSFNPSYISYGAYSPTSMSTVSLNYVDSSGSKVSYTSNPGFIARKCLKFNDKEVITYFKYLNTGKRGTIIVMLTSSGRMMSIGLDALENISTKLSDSSYFRIENNEKKMIGSEYYNNNGFNIIGFKSVYNSVFYSIRPIFRQAVNYTNPYFVPDNHYGKVVGKKYLPINMIYSDNNDPMIRICCTNLGGAENSQQYSIGGMFFYTNKNSYGTLAASQNSKCLDIQEWEKVIWESRSYYFPGNSQGVQVSFLNITAIGGSLVCDVGVGSISGSMMEEKVKEEGVLVGFYGASISVKNNPEISLLGPIWKKRVKTFSIRDYYLDETKAVDGKTKETTVSTQTIWNKSGLDQLVKVSGAYSTSLSNSLTVTGGTLGKVDTSSSFGFSAGGGFSREMGPDNLKKVRSLEASYSQSKSKGKSESWEKTWANGCTNTTSQAFTYSFDIAVSGKHSVNATIIFIQKETVIPWYAIIDTIYFDDTSDTTITTGVYTLNSFYTVTAQVGQQTPIP